MSADTTFVGFADFRGLVVTGHAFFSSSRFEQDVWFHSYGPLGGARFEGTASFASVTFRGEALFTGATFAAQTDFSDASGRTTTTPAADSSLRLTGVNVETPDLVRLPEGWTITDGKITDASDEAPSPVGRDAAVELKPEGRKDRAPSQDQMH